MNTLYYGDNLNILRRYIKGESVDLIYLDPPFNSNRNYNVLFKDESGAEADSQIMAFEDTWHWAGAAKTYHELILEGDKVSEMLQAFYGFIGTNQMMAYLVMMAVRLKELHRVLKPTGSLYLHCDPTASHYLKILLDTVFSPQNFRNEITWKRRVGSSSAVHESNKFGAVTDIVLFYVKSQEAVFHPQYNINDPDYQKYIKERFTQVDENGRRFQATSLVNPAYRPNLIYEYKGYKPPPNGWMITKEKMEQWDKEGRIYFPKEPEGRLRRKSYADELKGMPIQNLWSDIYEINSQAQERLGYPTQKPVALLERIIRASSNESDIVLDPFAGCGTTIAAAQKLNRRWIGIDITQLSIALLKNRLEGNFGLLPEGVKRSVPPAAAGGATKGSPPYEGGVAAASADGVVLSSAASDSTPDAERTTPTAKRGHPSFPKEGSFVDRSYRVVGEPEDLRDARQLATEHRYQFQYWALSLIQARPLGGQTDGRSGKKGSDKGIDGIKVFTDDNSGKAKRIIVQVKSGGVKSGDIRDLVGTIDREAAAIGVFLTLEPATSHMLNEAASAGFFHSDGWNKDYPRIQILTVEQLLNGKQVEMPPSGITFKQAEPLRQENTDQGDLFGGKTNE